MPDETRGQDPTGDADEERGSGTPADPLSKQKPKMGNAGDKYPKEGATETKQLARELHWLEKANFAGQIILAVVGITALAIYQGQLSVMRESIKQSQKALEISVATERVEQRAWVVVTESHLAQFGENKEIFADFLITNSGKTPARHLVFKRAFMWRLPTESDLKMLEMSHAGDTNLAPGEKRTERFAVTPPMSKETFLALTTSRATFSVLGEFLYQDVFGTEERFTPVCVYYDARIVPLLSGCSVGNRDMK